MEHIILEIAENISHYFATLPYSPANCIQRKCFQKIVNHASEAITDEVRITTARQLQLLDDPFCHAIVEEICATGQLSYVGQVWKSKHATPARIEAIEVANANFKRIGKRRNAVRPADQ